MTSPSPAVLQQAPVLLVTMEGAAGSGGGVPGEGGKGRLEHARLVQRLTLAGARAVVLVLPGEGRRVDTAGEAELAAAMRLNGRVFLAGEGSDRMDAALRSAAAGVVRLELVADTDGVVRRMPAWHPGEQSADLAWVVAQGIGLRGMEGRVDSEGGWTRYYGPPGSIPTVGFETVVGGQIDAERIRDRVVLVGQAAVGQVAGYGTRDWRSPHAFWDGEVPGMSPLEVHATRLMNLIRGDVLGRWPRGAEVWFLALGGFAWPWVLFRCRPLAAVGLALLGMLGVATVAHVVFRMGGEWFCWFPMVGAQIPVAALAAIGWQAWERHADRQREWSSVVEVAGWFEDSRDALVVLDLEGRRRRANAMAEVLLAGTKAFAGPVLWGEGDTGMDEARSRTLEAGGWKGWLGLSRSNGADVEFRSRWTLLRGEEGRPVGYLVAFEDAAEDRRREAEGLRVRQVETLSDLSGVVARDWWVVLGQMIEATSRGRQADGGGLAALDEIEALARRGARTAREALARLPEWRGERQPVAIEPLVREAEAVLRASWGSGVGLEVQVEPGLGLISGYASPLHRALLVLGWRARARATSGSVVHFDVRAVTVGVLEARKMLEARPGGYVRIRVSPVDVGEAGELHWPRQVDHLASVDVGAVPSTEGWAGWLERVAAGHRGYFTLTETGSGRALEAALYLPQASS